MCVTTAKKYLLLIVSVLFMLSSLGIAVGKHICHSQGIVELSLTGDFSCCGLEEQSCARVCCRKPTQENKKTGCCDDEVVYALLDIAQKHEERKGSRLFFTVVSFVIPFAHHQQIEQATGSFPFDAVLFKPVAGTVNLVLSLLSVFRI
jgi:hypothetical protein